MFVLLRLTWNCTSRDWMPRGTAGNTGDEPFAQPKEAECHATPLLHYEQDGYTRPANLCLISGTTFTASNPSLPPQTPSRSHPTCPRTLDVTSPGCAPCSSSARHPPHTQAWQKPTMPLLDFYGTRVFFLAGRQPSKLAGRWARP